MTIAKSNPVETDSLGSCECPWCGGECNATSEIVGQLDLRDFVPFDSDDLDSGIFEEGSVPAEILDLYLFCCSACGAKFPIPA